MVRGRLHADEVDTDVTLAGRLVRSQFPQWASLPLRPVDSAGTDNALYRLGDDMVVRVPRIESAAGQVAREHRWLPVIASLVPLAMPTPLARGRPAEGYPWQWSIYRWIEGDIATAAPVTDLVDAASALARFLIALRGIDPTEGPRPDSINSFRGAHLKVRDAAVRGATKSLGAAVDAEAVLAAWDAAVGAPKWRGSPVWIHGDLLPTNMLVRDGELVAVIDFGCLGVGDPACDLVAAWTYFSGESRDRFRSALQVDDATWARGRGWALSFGLIALPYYKDTNPVLADLARRAIAEALADA